jgi:hypothetical protein
VAERQEQQMAAILRDLDLVAWRLEQPPEGNERSRLLREVEDLRRRLEALARDQGMLGG